MGTRILILGSGGREHALAHRLAVGAGKSRYGDREVYVCPGNDGIAREFPCLAPEQTSAAGYVDVARRLAADLVVVGPEQPLVEGVVDALTEAGIAAFGPTAACAALEGSKAFMKDLVAAAGVPTARYGVFTSGDDAAAFIDSLNEGDLVSGAVVKCDGLAAGKGVTVCPDPADAARVAREFLGEGTAGPRFGAASRRIVVEELLPGVEFSVIALCDGQRSIPFASARDHKRLLDDDAGPNTGGMGAVAPLGAGDGMTPALAAQIEREIFAPTLAAFRARGTPYRGFLYAGLMVHEGRAKLLEFNVRLGDPEAQALLFGTEVDLLPSLLAVARGAGLPGDAPELAGRCRPTATIVCASPGYPEQPRTGAPISFAVLGDPGAERRLDFAGVRAAGDALVTAGGRVVAATACGDDLAQALASAYQLADAIDFEGKQMRRDIGRSIRRS